MIQRSPLARSWPMWLTALFWIPACGGPHAAPQEAASASKGDNQIFLPLICRNCDSGPTSWGVLEDAVLAAVNGHRASGARCGSTWYGPAAPLHTNTELRTAARLHSKDMADNNYFSHDSQDGRSPWDRIADAGYTGSASGENIAAGYSSAAAVVAGWMNSPGHCENIMRRCQGCRHEIGIGYAFNSGSTYGHYWTQNFGSRPLTTTSAPSTVSASSPRFYTAPLVSPTH